MKTPPDATARAQALLDDASRDELAIKHLDLVPRVVGRMPLPPQRGFDREDLISAGTLGLLTAARTFQPMRGASFRTFAYTAICAAVLDELRRHDPLPRGARRRLRELREFEERFAAERGRPPIPEEIATGLGISEHDSEVLLHHAEIDRMLREDQGDPAFSEPMDTSAADPSAEAETNEQLRRVEQAIDRLELRERQVVVLYHSEGLLLKEIGELLNVTESRVSQILACAHRKIRALAESAEENT